MKKKIIGMGNAVLDILAPVTEEFLNSKNLKKGSMILVNQEVSDKILREIDPIKKDSGGSVANTIVGTSLLGSDSFFCGKVKNDLLGNEFVKDMRNTNTKFLCNQSSTGLPTARCIIFVTPDGERSMQTFLGASTTLDEGDIEENFFDEMNFLLIEGYLWSSNSAKRAIKKAVEIAKRKNVKIIFSLSDFNLVKMFREEFSDFIKSHVHILIGNENEFEELFDNGVEEKFIQKNITELMIKTKGEKGVEVFQLDKKNSIPSFAVKSVVDTTGAGDMFAAGFLHQMINGKEPMECASFGCKMASVIIQQYGARLSKEMINDLVKKN